MASLRIDIPKVLQAKAPHTKVPSFAVRYLEHIVHVNEMNAFLQAHEGLEGLDFAREFIYNELGCTATISGVENIPSTPDPLLFVSNHPLGGLDGIVLALMVSEHRPSVKLIVNDLLMYMTPLASLFVPVNKVGSQSRQYAQLQRQLWESKEDIISFPAGACSRKHRFFDPHLTSVCDLTWQKSFIRHAVQYKRNIVPIYFEGRNSRFFYNLAYWRKKLGIKLNIEMLYLADEMYRAKNSHFTVHINPPIPYSALDASRTPMEWAEYVKHIVYETNY